MLETRAALASSSEISHADAELLAIGSLLLDGTPVRLSGQDCRRGTFYPTSRGDLRFCHRATLQRSQQSAGNGPAGQ